MGRFELTVSKQWESAKHWINSGSHCMSTLHYHFAYFWCSLWWQLFKLIDQHTNNITYLAYCVQWYKPICELPFSLTCLSCKSDPNLLTRSDMSKMQKLTWPSVMLTAKLKWSVSLMSQRRKVTVDQERSWDCKFGSKAIYCTVNCVGCTHRFGDI